MPASIGYTVATKTDLKNIADTIRVSGYLRFVLETYSWYVFVESVSNTPDDLNIIQPTAGTGRWFRVKSYVLANDISDLEEAVEDFIGNALTDTSTIDFTYNDSTGSIEAAIVSNSIGNSHIADNALSISKVNLLASELSSKAASSHTHSTSDITNLIETIQDNISTFIQAGSNITIDYNDVGNLLTISASSGGGAMTWDTIDIETWDGM